MFVQTQPFILPLRYINQQHIIHTFNLTIMSVRSQHARQSTNYIFATYQGQRYMLALGDFQQKTILYSTRKKLMAGKLSVPPMDNPTNKTVLITCSKADDGGLKFSII